MLLPQLREGFGADAFDDGCVYCKSLCCCADVNAGMNTRECPRPVHCYKKVRAAACDASGPRRWGRGQVPTVGVARGGRWLWRDRSSIQGATPP
jgi:hypothetical protein